MLQNPCKTLGFKKNMVYKIPPGGGEVNHIQPVAYMVYGKSSKTSKIFLFLLSNITWVIRAVIHNMLVRISNRVDPDKTASSEAV